jgi:PTS system D-glucosamine-specific IIC component
MKFNISTPGRNGNKVQLFTRKDVEKQKAASGNNQNATNERAQNIILGLGGKANIVDIGACTTRLRVQVVDLKKVNEKQLKETGALGFMKPSNTSIQIVYGPTVDAIKNNVLDELEKH